MSGIHSIHWGDAPTWGLLVGTIVTAIFAIRAFCKQAGKGLTGLDEHQVRRWDSWYRWTTLAMLALAFLTITSATEHAGHPAPADQIRSPATRSPRCSAR